MNFVKTVLITFIAFQLLGCNSKYGEIQTKNKNLIIKHGVSLFDKSLWKKSDQKDRGKMINNLFSNHKFIGSNVSKVKTLLGPWDCYIDDEHIPCYEVSLGGELCYLVFSVGHPKSSNKSTTSKISNVRLFTIN